ncbi:NAD(+) diphosphatase, partial [Myxococcota bacterium]|nr:NAD(+) diphosphatase [Myxococcota bacterium]
MSHTPNHLSFSQLVFQGSLVLVSSADHTVPADFHAISGKDHCVVSRGTAPVHPHDEIQWVEVETTFTPTEEYVFLNPRVLFPSLNAVDFAALGRALQIMDFRRTNAFCGRCGGATKQSTTEEARVCHHCKSTLYPVIAPAIIVGIERDGKILLARGSQHPAGRFSVLAGFVEPGETLEQAVIREVHEEVSIDIKEIKYFG